LRVSALRRGFLFALTANAVWGFFPLYFRALRPSEPGEVLAHRIVWSAVFVALVLVAVRRWRVVADLVRTPRTLGGIAAAAVFIGINWGVYIYAVDTERVVEASLGYFINPLVTILLGVMVLRERLRTAQWVALGTGGLAVAVLTYDHGALPWVALVLACSFAMYGLVKKRLAMPAAEGLLAESAVLVLPALAYLGVLFARNTSTFGEVSTPHTILLPLSGVLTAVPLLLFAGAANRISLSTIGMLQYLTPTIQLALGVLVLHEPMPPLRLAGFVLVWCALAVFTWDGIRAARRRSALVAAAV
jgi:chloramphenicol-sensitive protein RarD